MGYIKFIIFFLIFGSNFSVVAQTFHLSDDKGMLIQSIQYQQSDLSIEHIKQRQENWQPIKANTINFGFSGDSYWLKIKIKNDTSSLDWFLTLDNTRLDYVDFYLSEQSLFLGDHRSLKGQRETYPTFKFSLTPGDSEILFFRVQSGAQVAFNPIIRNSLEYGRYLGKRHDLHIFYLVLLVLFILIQLILNRGYLSKMNLSYCACLYFAFAYMLFYYGDGNLIFWPDNATLKNRMHYVFSSMSLVFFAIFMQQYLNNKVSHPRYHQLINFFIIVGLISAMLMLLPMPNILRVIFICVYAYLIALFSIVGAVKSINSGRLWAIGLTTPLACSTLALLIYVSTFCGLLPYTVVTSNIVLWSLPLDIMLISISFVFRHVSLQSEHQKLMCKLHHLSKGTVVPSYNEGKQTKRYTDKRKVSRLGNIDTDDILVKLIQHIEKNKAFLRSGLTLDEVACELNIRADQLSNIINTQLQISFSTLLNVKRLEESARLLKSSPNKSVLDIALECGFGSKSSFNRLFKQQFGTTPTQYRKFSV